MNNKLLFTILYSDKCPQPILEHEVYSIVRMGTACIGLYKCTMVPSDVANRISDSVSYLVRMNAGTIMRIVYCACVAKCIPPV